MALHVNTVGPKNLPYLLSKLAPLGETDGVQDYLLADSAGGILARKPGSVWEDDVAAACARDVAQAGAILSFQSSPDGGERVFDFRFEGALLVVWDWGSVYLLALCNEEVNLPMVRMTANVVKEDLKKDKRFRSCFAPRRGEDRDVLSEQHLGRELHRHVMVLKHEP